MASIENDDDDFLASPPEDGLPSPRKSLKRLKKKADKKSEVPKSPRRADSISALDFSPSTDPTFGSTQELSPSVQSQRHSKPIELQSAELPWNLCAKSGDDNLLLESNFEMEPTNVFEDTTSDAVQEDLTGLDPNEDQDNDELDNCDAEDGSSSESEEEVDEDDELAVLNLLEKARKSSTPSEKAAPRVPALQTPPVSLHSEDAADTTHKTKKIKAAELEEMHAASQRLLRETPNASFKLQVLTGKSISSVLEKIRWRKMQLVQGWKSASTVHESEDALEQIDQELLSSKNVPPHAQNVLEVEDVGNQENGGEEILQCNVNKNAEGDVVSTPERHAEGDVSSQVSTPEKLAAGHKSDDMEKSTYLGSGNVFRAPMEDTQDLLSPSQSSQEDIGENLNLDTEEDNIFGGSRVNLHFDTETQDDYEQWQDEEANKENMEPTLSDRLFNAPIAKGPSVRALIDDEAEDEDEDILVPGEEDEGDEGQDLQDMVIEETNEKEKDREKRAELHRKWLEQQDAVMTDDILLRLKTGWRPRESRKRGLDFLDDDMELFVEKDRNIPDLEAEPQVFREPSDENSQDAEALRDEAHQDEARAFSFPEDLNDVHESDDEEAEQRMMRQRFLQESEEQGDLMSPADDETSREIFVLINKVNIASSNKKLKQGSVNDLRYLAGGTSNSNSSLTSKSSFLRRSVSSTVGSVQRQGSNSGSGTRSFIFGRDDSNSSHSFDQHVDMREIKENLEPTSQGLRKETSHNKHIGQGQNNSKVSKSSSATRLGPSLFEILRRQSTNLDQSLQKKSFDEGSPILAAFKPIKATIASRGARRA